MKKLLIFLFFLEWSVMVFAQSDPGLDPKAVQQLMLQGRLDLIESKFRDLRLARGNELGKAIQDPIYRAPDSASIFYPEVDKIWNACLDNLMIWERSCPEIFPAIPATALGCCFAMQEGDPSVLPKLRDVAEMLLAQQYHPRNVSIANGTIPGVFGVAHVSQQALCSQSGAIQRNAAFMCRESPGCCPVYQKGAFAGQAFAVADQLPEELYFNGSLAALQSGSIALMLALHLQTHDSVYLEAARSCGNWCMAENPFFNHRPTAHLILALAALYEYTGEKEWKDRMLYLLKASVLPGILLDADQNGMADGTPTLFAGLVPYAQIPGRMWDAQNASSWNTAICAWSVAHAATALYNRGDTEESSPLFGIASQMMDNLCLELVQYGTPPPGSGFVDLAYAVLQIDWHFTRLQKIPNPLWDKAIRILWNAGAMQRGGDFAINVGQMMRRLKGINYPGGKR